LRYDPFVIKLKQQAVIINTKPDKVKINVIINAVIRQEDLIDGRETETSHRWRVIFSQDPISR